MTVEDGEDWIWKNKDSGQIAASASLGLLNLWNIEEGYAKLDKYMEVNNDLIVAGAYMGAGLLSSGIQNECDPVFGLLESGLSSTNEHLKIGTLMGLSFAYAGQAREDILEEVSPLILDGDNPIEVVAIAALSLGVIFVGTCN